MPVPRNNQRVWGLTGVGQNQTLIDIFQLKAQF